MGAPVPAGAVQANMSRDFGFRQGLAAASKEKQQIADRAQGQETGNRQSQSSSARTPSSRSGTVLTSPLGLGSNQGGRTLLTA